MKSVEINQHSIFVSVQITGYQTNGLISIIFVSSRLDFELDLIITLNLKSWSKITNLLMSNFNTRFKFEPVRRFFSDNLTEKNLFI